MPKLIACRHIFSNGTEFELFMERCFRCSRYRNDHCRILNACYKAMWNLDEFPYDDLMEWDNGYGGKSCRHYTEEPMSRKNRTARQTKGQMSFL